MARVVAVQLARQRADLLLAGHAAFGRGIQRLAERTGILVTLERILRERAECDGIERPRDGLDDLRRREGRLAHMLIRDRYRGVAAERRPAGEHLVEHDTSRVHVGAGVDGLALRLLGGEIGGGADDRRRLRDGGRRIRDGAGDAEVHHLDLAVAGHHDVAGLDVAVHDAGAMRVLECLEDAVGVAQGIGDRHGAVVDDVLQQAPRHQLHDDVGHRMGRAIGIRLAVLAGIVDADDRRMRHAGGGLGLQPEARAEGGIGGELALEDLDRDLASEGDVLAAVDAGHAATPDQLVDPIAVGQHARLHRHFSPWQHSAASLTDRVRVLPVTASPTASV